MPDIMCAIEDQFINDVGKALYWTGAIPDKIKFSDNLPNSKVVAYFEEPGTWFDMSDDGKITVNIALPLYLIAPDIDGVAEGRVFLKIPISLLVIHDGDQTHKNLSIDISKAVNDNPNDVITIVLFDQPYKYDMVTYRLELLYGINQSLLKIKPISFPLVIDAFPKLSIGAAYCHTSINTHRELRLTGNVDGQPIKGHACSPGGNFDGKVKKNVLYPTRACMIADPGFLLARIHQVLADNSVGPGKVLIDNLNRTILDLDTGIGGDVTIDTGIDSPFVPATITLPFALDFSPVLNSITLESELDVSLGESGLIVSGRVTADVSNSPDPEFDFIVGITLEMTSEGSFAPRIVFTDANYDADFVTTIAVILLGPIGLILAEMLDQMLDARANKELGGGANTALNDPKIASLIRKANLLPAHFELTGDPDPAKQINVTVQASGISIGGEGIRVDSQIRVDYARRHVEYAPYYRGNTDSLELHLSGCPFGDRIGTKRLKIFYRLQDARDLGFDPCRRCMGPSLDGGGALRVRLTYESHAHDQIIAPVKVKAERLSGPDSKFLTSFSLEQYLQNPGGQFFNFKPMANGLWRFTVTDGAWTSEPRIEQLTNYGKWMQIKIVRDA